MSYWPEQEATGALGRCSQGSPVPQPWKLDLIAGPRAAPSGREHISDTALPIRDKLSLSGLFSDAPPTPYPPSHTSDFHQILLPVIVICRLGYLVSFKKAVSLGSPRSPPHT